MTYRVTVLEGGKEEAWKAGFSARHSRLFFIKIFRDLPNFVGILAQEIYEIERKQKAVAAVALLGMILAGVAFHLTGIPETLALLLITLFSPLAANFSLNRNTELMSHAIEIQAGLKFGQIADLEAYEWKEAKSLVGSNNHPWMKEMTADEIAAETRKRYPAARKWVERKAKALSRY